MRLFGDTSPIFYSRSSQVSSHFIFLRGEMRPTSTLQRTFVFALAQAVFLGQVLLALR